MPTNKPLDDYEGSYGSQMESYYKENRQRLSKKGVNPDRFARGLFKAGKGVEEGDSFETWTAKHKMDRFAQNISSFEQEETRLLQDEETRKKNLAERGDFARGMSSGVDQLQGAVGGGVLMGLGKLASYAGGDNVVSKYLTNKGFDVYQEQMRQASLNPTKSLLSQEEGKWVNEELQTPEDYLDAIAGTLGNLVPSMAVGLISGGTGALVGGMAKEGVKGAMSYFVKNQAQRLIAKGIVGDVVEGGVTKVAATQVAEAMAKKYVGGRVGAILGTAMMEGSGSFADTVDHMRNKFLAEGMSSEEALLKATDEASGMLAMGTGLAAGMVEIFGGNIRILDMVLGDLEGKTAKQLIKAATHARANPGLRGKALNAMRDLMVEAVKQAPAEFAQEATQEILALANVNFADPDFEILSQENFKRVLESGLAGAIGGIGGGFATQLGPQAKVLIGSQETPETKLSELKIQVSRQEAMLSRGQIIPGLEESLAKNKSELDLLQKHVSVEKDGIKFADAVARIQAEAPDPSGKAFNTKALKNLVRHGNLATIDEGVIDKKSLEAFITGRKEKAAVEPAEVNPATVAPLAEDVEAPETKVKAPEVKLPQEEEIDSDEVVLDLASREIADISVEEEAEMEYRRMEEEQSLGDTDEVELDLRDEDAKAGPAPKFSRATREFEGPGLGRDRVTEQLSKSGLAEVSNVFESTDELDEGTRTMLKEREAEDAPAFWHNGKLHVNAARVENDDHAADLVAHEIIHPAEEAHVAELAKKLGVEGAYKEWNRTLDHVFSSYGKEIESLAKDRGYEKDYDLSTEAGRRGIAGELLADKNIKGGEKFYDRAVSALKKIVNAVRRAMGLKEMNLGESEVRVLLSKMKGSLEKQGQLKGVVAPRFSRGKIQGFEANVDTNQPIKTQREQLSFNLSGLQETKKYLEDKTDRAIKLIQGMGGISIESLEEFIGASQSDKIKELKTKFGKGVITDTSKYGLDQAAQQLTELMPELDLQGDHQALLDLLTDDLMSKAEINRQYSSARSALMEHQKRLHPKDLAGKTALAAAISAEGRVKRGVEEADRMEMDPADPSVTELEDSAKGINISSYETGLGEKLTNFAKIPVTVRGKKYARSEDAYQDLKKTLHDLSDANVLGLMTEIVTAKLEQNPALRRAIDTAGGMSLLENSTHNLVKDGKEVKKDRWTGKDGLFMQALRQAYSGKAALAAAISAEGREAKGTRFARTTRQERITRQDIKKNPDTVYLFGDNLQGKGLGGQAKEMRGEPNSIGIPTKKAPSMSENSFFTDSEYDQNVMAIDAAFAKIPKGKNIVIPKAGLGTGLSQLEQRAPKTLAYLNQRLSEIENASTDKPVPTREEGGRTEEQISSEATPEEKAQLLAQKEDVHTAVVDKFGETPFRQQPSGAPKLEREKKTEVKKPEPLPAPVPRTPDAPLDKTPKVAPVVEDKPVESFIRQKITFPEDTFEHPVSESLEEDVDRSVPPSLINKDKLTPSNAVPMPVVKYGKTLEEAKEKSKKRLTKKQKAEIEKQEAEAARQKMEFLTPIEDDEIAGAEGVVSNERGKSSSEKDAVEDAKVQAERIRKDKVRQRLIEEGRFAQTPKYVIEANLEIDKINKKLFYKHFPEVKLYAQYLEERMLEDIEGDETLRKLPYGIKRAYARIQAAEKAQTLYGGKLSPEARDSFDAAAVEIQAKGIDRVASARLDRATGLQVVAALAQRDTQRSAVALERQNAIPEAIATNADAYFLDWAFRFSNLLRSADVTRAATTGQTVNTSLTVYQNAQGEDLGADFAKHIKDLYGDIFKHLEALDVFTQEELDALRIENNSLLDNFVRQPRTARNTSLDILEGALDALSGEYGGHDFRAALKRFMPIPDISIVGIENPISEMDEVVAAFRRVEGDRASELSNSEIVIGMLGMGLGRTTDMNSDLKNIFDGTKLPDEFLIKMEKAGFIEIQRRYGKPNGAYAVLDGFKKGSIPAAIRKQTFMKDLDLSSEPRTASVYGAYFEPFKYAKAESVEVSTDEATGKLVTMPANTKRKIYDSRLADFRQIKPGSIFLSVMPDGTERALVMGLPKPDGSARFYAPVKQREVKDEAAGNAKTIHSLQEVVVHTEEKLSLVPSVWNALQGHPVYGSKSTGKMKYNNFWTTLNAMGAVKSRELMAKVFNDTGIDVRRAGHATIVTDQMGNEALLVSDIVSQHVIHLVSEETSSLPDVADAVAVLRHEMGTQLAGLVEMSVSQDNEARALAGVRMVRDKLHKRIDALVAARKLNENEAAGLKEAVSSIISTIHENISKVHGGKDFRKNVRKVLLDAGILSADERTDAERKEAALREVMGSEATAEQDIRSGKTMDEEGNQEDGGSSFSGLTDSQSLAGELGMASAMEEVLASMEDVDRAYNKVMGLKIPKDWFFPKSFLTSPLFAAVPSEVSSAFRSSVLFMPRNAKVENSETFMQSLGRFGDKPVLTLSDLLRATHPGGRSAALYTLSSMSQMSDAALAEYGVTKLDVNVAYVEAAQTMALPRAGGGTIALDDLHKGDKDLAMAMLGAAGLYGQVGQSWSITNASTDENGKTTWPRLQTWDQDAMREVARTFKLVTATSALQGGDVLTLPTGTAFDAQALALSLARREIPFDIGMAAAGLDPDTRREFSPREAYKHQRPELFLNEEAPIALSRENYDKLLEEELSLVKEQAQRIEKVFADKDEITKTSWLDYVKDVDAILETGPDGTFENGFTLHGVRYIKTDNVETELPVKNDVITGLDYQQLLLLHEARGADSERVESKTAARDGRTAMVSIGGEIYPIEYKENVLTPFGWGIRQELEAEYDSARNDKDIDEKTRKRILAVMEKDLLRTRTITRGEAKKLRDLYKFRVSKKDRRLKFDSEGSMAGELAKALNMLRSVMRTFLSIPEAEMPGVIMHGPDKDALSMWHSPSERGLLPPEIAGRMLTDPENTIRSLQGSMGFVGTDGNIHIFPKNHGNAYGQLDNLELVKTLFHELVGHVALPKLLGTEYTGFMESVFRKHIDVNGNLSSLSSAEKVRRAEEYVAQMAEQVKSFDKATGRYELEHIGSVMDHLGSMLMRLIRKVARKFGMDIEISKMEIRDMLSNAFRGVPIVPKNIVPSAFVPAENIGEYSNFQYYKANIADRFIRNVADSLRSWEMLYRANMRTSAPHASMSGVMHALRTQKSRIGFLTGVSKELENKFVSHFKGKDYTQAEVSQLLQALHTEERLTLDFDNNMDVFRSYLERKGKTAQEIGRILSGYQRRYASFTFDKLTGMNMRQARGIIGDFQRRGWITETERGVYSGSMMGAVNIVLESSRMSLNVSELSGMLSTEAASYIRDRYKYYVPLPGKGLHGFGEGGGFKLIGKNRFASQIDAGGFVSRGERPDLIGYAFATLRQRIVEAEINQTGRSIADFVRAEMLNRDEHGGYTGNSLQGVFSYYITREEKASLIQELERTGVEEPEMWMIQNGLQDMPDTSDWTIERLRLYEADMGLIPVFEAGKMRYVRIEHDGLKSAYDKLQNPAKMGPAMQFMGKINRWLIGVNTMLNPEFVLPNMIRDYGAAFSVLSISGHVAGLENMTGKEFAKQMSPRVPLAVKAIFNHNFRKGAAGLTGESLEIYNYIKEFEESGGKIQWPFMESSVETMNNLRESIAVAQGKGTLWAKAKSFGRAAEDLMRRTSDVFENSTRLALFVTARKNGASIEESALLSRGTTVDFDRRGDVGQIFNTLYLFANAGLQGTLVSVRAMKNNPKKAMQFFGGVAALSFSIAVANMFLGGDGDDGEPNAFGIPEETRNSNLTIMIPFSDGSAIKIPMSYGPMSFFWAVGQELANSMFSRRSTLQAAGGMAASLLSNFNPLETAAGLDDSHGWTRFIMPTLADPFVDIAFEQTAFGSPLMPTPLYEGQPDATRHWRSVSTVSKEATRMLNEFFGGSGGVSSGPLTDYSPETLDLLYDNAAGGLGKFIARSLGLAFAPVTGKEIGVNDIPMVRRFFAGQLNWEDRGRFKSNYEEVQGVHRTYETLKKNVSMARIPELKAQATRDRDDFLKENKHILSLHKIANNTRSQAGALDSRKEALYKSGFSQKEIADQLRALNERQKEIYRNFNRRYYEVVG